MTDVLVSVSGGQTSAYMSMLLLKINPSNLRFVFANTGQEHPKTIEFLKNLQDDIKKEIVCIEALVNPEKRKGTKYQIKTLDTLSMNGEPFVEVIKKYGIPNNGFPHCTRELKTSPIHAWAKEHLSVDYQTAIGIRADEIDRMNPNKEKLRYKYPLVSLGVTKEEVNNFFDNYKYKLEIPHYLGNCITCWKKSDLKLSKVYNENNSYFDFFAEMERSYPNAGAGEGNRKFWRKHRSTQDMILEFNKRNNLSDEASGCGGHDSCEAF